MASPYKPPLHLNIPVALPGILKDYTKAVLRNQPDDLYSWSADYFRQLSEIYVGNNSKIDKVEPSESVAMGNDANGSEVKDTSDGDNPPIDFKGWKSVYNELCNYGSLSFENLKDTWTNRGFSSVQLSELLTVGEFYTGVVDLNKFNALVCGTLAPTLTKTMHLATMLYSGVNDETDTKSAKIPYDVFEEIYTFMTSLDSDVAPSGVKKALIYLKKISLTNGGVISAKDFLSRFCPKLE